MTVAENRTRIVRTSLHIQRDVWDSLRIAAIKRQMTAGQAVEQAIQKWVEAADAEAIFPGDGNAA